MEEVGSHVSHVPQGRRVPACGEMEQEGEWAKCHHQIETGGQVCVAGSRSGGPAAKGATGSGHLSGSRWKPQPFCSAAFQDPGLTFPLPPAAEAPGANTCWTPAPSRLQSAPRSAQAGKHTTISSSLLPLLGKYFVVVGCYIHK